MAPRKKSAKAASAEVFDLSQFREEKRYVWREIEREGGEPLRVKLLRLTLREVEDIPYTTTTAMRDVYKAIAPYVAEWDFTAENLETGEVVPIPPPAEVGGDVFELMENTVGNEIAQWLKLPRFMERDELKKALASSENGEPPPSESDSE